MAALRSVQHSNVSHASKTVDFITFSIVCLALLYLLGGLSRIFGPIWRQLKMRNSQGTTTENGTFISIDDHEQHHLLQERTSLALAEELEAEDSIDETFKFPDDPSLLPAQSHGWVPDVSSEPFAAPAPRSELLIPDSIELDELMLHKDVEQSSPPSPVQARTDEHGMSSLTRSNTSAQHAQVFAVSEPSPSPSVTQWTPWTE